MLNTSLLTIALAAAATTPVMEAERLAFQAVRAAPRQPDQALALARQALDLTKEFDPIAFVKAGRKGEVVEDEFQAAREAYRAHRAQIYEAMGTALAAGGKYEAAARYFRRAFLLEAAPERLASLARALLALGRGGEALALVQTHAGPGGPTRDTVVLIEQAVDAAGLPSAQVEIDRARLGGLSPRPSEVRDGPFKLPAGARLSTGGQLLLEAGPTVFYVAARACRTCSEDLEALKQMVGTARVLLVPEDPNNDHPLRQVVQLYRFEWPVALGQGMAAALGVPPGAVLVVGRAGYLSVPVPRPFTPMLPAVLGVLARSDVTETVPRKAWNLRPPERRAAPKAPGLLAEGLAPGDDEPAPAEFTRAVEAYRKHRYAEALTALQQLAARGDGWLLPPEARFNRAVLLGRMGRAEEARRMLLRIGDSRFQEDVDRTLERVGSQKR